MSWKKRHKYRAKPVRTADGYFPSRKEFKRWEQLKLLEMAGEIYRLSRKREDCTFPLYGSDGTTKVCDYVADYVYEENLQKVAEDAKGYRTDVYKLKRKLFVVQYPDYEHRES